MRIRFPKRQGVSRKILEKMVLVSACTMFILACSPSLGPSSGAAPDNSGSASPEPSGSDESAQTEGIDVSHFQNTVDWAAVAASGKSFGIAKATEGIDYKDPQFDANWSSLADQGLLRGAYHFFVAHDDAKTQAEFFLSTVSLQVGDLVPILDVESSDVSAEATIQGVQTWLDTVEAAVGQKPMIYTDPNFWNSLGDTSSFRAYPLWIASYDVEAPELPSTWDTWTLWQYSQTGTVDGVGKEVDLDVYGGSLTEMKKELGLTSVP